MARASPASRRLIASRRVLASQGAPERQHATFAASVLCERNGVPVPLRLSGPLRQRGTWKGDGLPRPSSGCRNGRTGSLLSSLPGSGPSAPRRYPCATGSSARYTASAGGRAAGSLASIAATSASTAGGTAGRAAATRGAADSGARPAAAPATTRGMGRHR